MIILALVSGIAATTLRSHLDNAAVERAYEQFALAHTLARRAAMEGGSTSEATPIRIEVQERRLDVLGPQRKFKMPSGVRLNLQVSSQAVRSSKPQITFAGNGTSPTYVLKLESRDIWFIALGATGQCLKTNDPKLAEAMLR